jgi:hypothetical protein
VRRRAPSAVSLRPRSVVINGKSCSRSRPACYNNAKIIREKVFEFSGVDAGLAGLSRESQAERGLLGALPMNLRAYARRTCIGSCRPWIVSILSHIVRLE